MLDHFPLFNDLKCYMGCIERRYECWCSNKAYQENNDFLLRLYEGNVPVEMINILIQYNRFIYNLHK